MSYLIKILCFFVLQSAMSADYDHHSFSQFKVPKRQQSVIVSSEGYYPEVITAFAGEEIELFVTSTEKKSCLSIEGIDFHVLAEPGKVNSKKVTVSSEGRYRIHCPGMSLQASLVVLGKRVDRTQPRSPASAVDRDVWRPREY